MRKYDMDPNFVFKSSIEWMGREMSLPYKIKMDLYIEVNYINGYFINNSYSYYFKGN